MWGCGTHAKTIWVTVSSLPEHANVLVRCNNVLFHCSLNVNRAAHCRLHFDSNSPGVICSSPNAIPAG